MPSSTASPSGSKLIAHALLAAAVVLGPASLLVWGWFALTGALNLVALGLGETGALAFDACLSVVFFVQHSGMIRKSFRGRSTGLIPPHYRNAVFTVTSGVVLLTVIVLWQESGPPLVSLPTVLRWALRALWFVSVAGFLWGSRALRYFDPYGIKPIRSHLYGTELRTMPFAVRGPYRWVRHPLYFFVVLMIWSYPDVTADRLLFNVLWTAWIVVGAVLEERDMVAEFGDVYRDYQRKVPMLIPYRFRPAWPER